MRLTLTVIAMLFILKYFSNAESGVLVVHVVYIGNERTCIV